MVITSISTFDCHRCLQPPLQTGWLASRIWYELWNFTQNFISFSNGLRGITQHSSALSATVCVRNECWLILVKQRFDSLKYYSKAYDNYFRCNRVKSSSLFGHSVELKFLYCSVCKLKMLVILVEIHGCDAMLYTLLSVYWKLSSFYLTNFENSCFFFHTMTLLASDWSWA